jgi:hypothetical protein
MLSPASQASAADLGLRIESFSRFALIASGSLSGQPPGRRRYNSE